MGQATDFLNKKKRTEERNSRQAKANEIRKNGAYSFGKYLTPVEASAYLGISVYTLSKYRIDRDNKNRRSDVFIPFIKVGRNIRYTKEDLDEYMDGCCIGDAK